MDDERMDSLLETQPVSSIATHLENELMLTPTRKVKALLAQFDDSDSDQDPSAIDPPGANAPVPVPVLQAKWDDSTKSVLASLVAGGTDSDDDDVRRGRPSGRLAARMQAADITKYGHSPRNDAIDTDQVSTKAAKSCGQLLAQKSTPETALRIISDHEGSEDDLHYSTQNPKTLGKNRTSSIVGSIAPSSIRSTSPLFFPSPTTARPHTESNSRRPSQAESESDDLPDRPLEQGGSKFLALVGKHRRARLAREAAEGAKRAERLAQLKKVSSRSSPNAAAAALGNTSDGSEMSDGNVGERMTQPGRTARKASKKALEEMNRETQRMSRSMQLAHQAKTKKKISKESLLARFNFSASEPVLAQTVDTAPFPSVTSSAPTSDVEAEKSEHTPPTSPLPSQHKDCQPLETNIFNTAQEQPSPSGQDLHVTQPALLGKGKGKATLIHVTRAPTRKSKQNVSRIRPIRFTSSKQSSLSAQKADSDSDLEIVTAKPNLRKIGVFERLPGKKAHETTSHLMLRALANLPTINSGNKQSSMNVAQMEARLRRAARLQAHQERQEKVDELRSKGVFIPTDEERMKEQQEVEDLVERERRKNVEIQREERKLAKKDGTYVRDQLLDDESEDEEDADFQDEDGVEGHEPDSEDEEEEDDGEESDIEEETEFQEGPAKERNLLEHLPATMVDQEADPELQEKDAKTLQVEQEVEERQASDDESTFSQETRAPRHGRTRRPVLLSDDEEDEGENQQGNARHASPSRHLKTPQSIPTSVRKIIPGLHMSDALPIGLTQAFAATMAETEAEDDDEDYRTREQDHPTMTRELPSPQFHAAPSLRRFDTVEIVTDSQPTAQVESSGPDFSLPLTRGVSQSPAKFSSTQLSFMPTQDVGCVLSPFKDNRFDSPTQEPQSTTDTVLLPPVESRKIERRSKLRRGRNVSHSDDDDDVEDGGSHAMRLGVDISAFSAKYHVNKEVSHRAAFDKLKSNAKEAIEEVAEESEDEYAGLGGASDEDEGDEDEADRQMIDHNDKLGQGDEAKFAGFYADKERKQDEAAVSKLYKDITTGALRRKRGAADDLDLSDEEETSARRREAKRREFARMRRELLKDEAVGKIAEDKKKEAFLKSIEDRDNLEDEAVDSGGEGETETDSQLLSQPVQVGGQLEIFATSNKALNKRALEPAVADITNRPFPSARRTTGKPNPPSRKPSNLAEVRQQISFLVEDSDSQNKPFDLPDSDEEPEAYVDLDRHLQSTDDEDEEPDKGLANFIVDDSETRTGFKKPELPPFNRPPATERRTKSNVVDRLSLLRQASSSSTTSSLTRTTSGTNSRRLAFMASTENLASATSSSSTTTVKTPTPFFLRRRSSTNTSVNSTSFTSNASNPSIGLTERGAVEHEKGMIRKAQGGKRSTVNYYARGRLEEREKARLGAGGGGRSISDGGRREKLISAGKVGKKNHGAKQKRQKDGKGGFLGGLFGQGSWE